MYRREILAGAAAAGAVVLAGCEGCLGGSRRFHFQEISPAEIAKQEASTMTDVAYNPLLEDLVSRLLDEEEVIIETMAASLLDERTHFREEEQFYWIEEEVLEENEVTGPQYTISGQHHTTVSDDEALSITDLPRHDQWRITDAVEFNDDGEVDLNVSTAVTAGYLDADDHSESLLVDGLDHQYIDFHGSYLEAERGDEESATVNRIQLSATPAESTEQFIDNVLEKYGTELSHVDDDASYLINETKQAGGSLRFETCEQDDGPQSTPEYEGYNQLQDEIEDTPESSRDLHREEYYVLYEDEWYSVRFRR
ncbi:hypothetical protein OB905_06600 [Halobacteria archaeon AArc-dxtr1]|nr:hypothetical protein [Halobacteria archaeon AArc-dxtr1]